MPAAGQDMQVDFKPVPFAFDVIHGFWPFLVSFRCSSMSCASDQLRKSTTGIWEPVEK